MNAIYVPAWPLTCVHSGGARDMVRRNVDAKRVPSGRRDAKLRPLYINPLYAYARTLGVVVGRTLFSVHASRTLRMETWLLARAG